MNQRPESTAVLARSYYRTSQRQKAEDTLSALLLPRAGPEGVFFGGQVASEEGDGKTALAIQVDRINLSRPGQASLQLHSSPISRRPISRMPGDTVKPARDRAGDERRLQPAGLVLLKQGKYKETVRAFYQAIDLEPRKESNFLDLAQTLIEHHLYGIASAVAQKAVERIPNSYRAYMLKGAVEAKQGRYSEAIGGYAKACELNPGSPAANFNLARVQSWQVGRRMPRGPLSKASGDFLTTL